jgi:hypothetical protein
MTPHRSLTVSQHTSARVCLAVLCLSLACHNDKPRPLPADEPVARVNGTTITRSDIEFSAKRSLGEIANASVERAAFPRLVDAAVRSRAISMAAERELNDADKKALEREVTAYREQLLVRRYLERHHPAKPVTSEMALDYYKHYPERFGASTARDYELVGATRSLSTDERTRMLAKLTEGASKQDWKVWAESLQKAGYPLTFSGSSSDDKLLQPKLRTLLEGLKAGTPSSVVFVEGRAYIARVVAETARPPQPFEAVREDIQRLLAPTQLSAAVEQAAAEVLKTAKVEILPAAQHGGSAPPSKGGTR